MALSMALGGGTLGIMMNEDLEGRFFFFASWAICVTDTSLLLQGFIFVSFWFSSSPFSFIVMSAFLLLSLSRAAFRKDRLAI